MIRDKTFRAACLGALITGVIGGVSHGIDSAEANTTIKQLTEQLEQYTQECDGAALSATLRSCFDGRIKSCGMGQEECSRRAMDQCYRIAQGVHCVGRKK